MRKNELEAYLRIDYRLVKSARYDSKTKNLTIHYTDYYDESSKFVTLKLTKKKTRNDIISKFESETGKLVQTYSSGDD